jgi:hypothetical protein
MIAQRMGGNMKTMHASRITLAILMLASTVASGAAQRTFVASNGVDSNPCSIVQPCRSFGAAIAKTLPAGEVIVQDSAGYGVVTITQSVSIIAPSGVYAGISVPAGQTGVTVNGGLIVVVLRGLSINGLFGAGSQGISFIQGQRLRIESCEIAGLGSTAIVDSAAGSELTILDTIVRDNGGAGINLTVGASMLLDGVRVEHNAGDGVLVSSAVTGASATIRNSVLSYNGQAGVAGFMPADPATSRVVVENSLLSRNSGDGATVGGATDGQVIGVFSRNVIERNGLSGISAFNLVSGGVASVDTFDNTFSGNGNSGVKVQGFPSQVFLGHNYFARDESSLLKVSGGFLGSYGDNSGAGGGATTPTSQF